jgi:hypothetical protein
MYPVAPVTKQSAGLPSEFLRSGSSAVISLGIEGYFLLAVLAGLGLAVRASLAVGAGLAVRVSAG